VIERERVTELNNAPEQSGDYVLYWMQNSQRAEFNPALEVAIADANRLGLPVIVGFGLTAEYPEANARHYAFMLEGLAETAHTLRQRGLGFAIRLGNPDDVALSLAKRAALVVCDRSYLRPQRKWHARVAAEAGRRVLQVEGDLVVPVELVSIKPEVGARTLRPKLLRVRDQFLAPASPSAAQSLRRAHQGRRERRPQRHPRADCATRRRSQCITGRQYPGWVQRGKAAPR